MKYYCGPFYFPSFVKKYLSRRFNSSCKIHDQDYKKRDASRKDIDAVFLNNMLDQSDNEKDKKSAHRFYKIVRIFGGISWFFHKTFK